MYSHAAPKVGLDYKRAKSGLQDKLRKKNSRNSITCWRTRRTYKVIPGFQKKKARNLPKSSKNLDNFITFYFKFFFENFPKSSLDHVAWDFFINKLPNFPHKKRLTGGLQ
jgi:hypothetical protein